MALPTACCSVRVSTLERRGDTYRGQTRRESRCDASRRDDTNVCCEAIISALCSTVAGTIGFCGAGKSYDKDKAANKCVGAACSAADKDDVNSCCKANIGAVCSSIKSKSGFCGLPIAETDALVEV